MFLAPAATTPQPSLCVSVQRTQDSVPRGTAAIWQVSTWTLNGDASGVVIKLAAAPTGQQAAFSFGCGSQDGTSACNLGTVFSGSAARQVLAKVTVPATASSVTAVKLTASLTAAHLVKTPAVAVAISVTAPGTPTVPVTPTSSPAGTGAGGTGTGTGAGGTGSVTSPLPVGSLPTIGGTGSTSLSPGGNASGLFPTVNPSAVPTPSPNQGQGSSNEVAKRVANSDAMPIGTPVIDAQLAGLAALGVAFMLAVTRLSVRRRPSAAKAAAAAELAGASEPALTAKPTETALADADKAAAEKPADEK